MTRSAASRRLVTHVIEQLSPGGPLHAVLGFQRQAVIRETTRHRIISLLPPDARAVRAAEHAGIGVAPRPDAEVLARELGAADLVHVHFWNNPALFAWMTSATPAMRVLIWCHVNGLHAPYVLPQSLLEFGDLVAVTSRASLDLPVFRHVDQHRLAFLFAGADFSRLADDGPAPHAEFTVGYLGRLDFVKAHPDLIPMSAAVRSGPLRFHFCGGGADQSEVERQAETHGIRHRCTFTDHREEIAPLLASFDVLGYPLRSDTSCTSELALQEAMYMGVPPVVFPHGGLDKIVRHGHNGLVVHTPQEYAGAIDHLFDHPSKRARLGTNAARDARATFGAGRSAAGMAAAYEQLCRLPKRQRVAAIDARPCPGARAFVESLDGQDDGIFRASLAGSEAEAAEAAIANLGPQWRQVILQYRVFYPSDPILRLWSGLLLRCQRPALAASEFRGCQRLGFSPPRVERYRAGVGGSPP